VESLDTKVGILGTPWYIAPEILSTGKNYSTASDIYATGMVLWEIFEDNNKPGLVDASQTNYFAFWKKVVDEKLRPPFRNIPIYDIQKLINQMWDQDATKRPDCELITQKFADIIKNAYSSIHVTENPQISILVDSLTTTPIIVPTIKL